MNVKRKKLTKKCSIELRKSHHTLLPPIKKKKKRERKYPIDVLKIELNNELWPSVTTSLII